MAASPGKFGGINSLWATRVPFEVLGAYVYPKMQAFPSAHTAFSEAGDFLDEKIKLSVKSGLESFLAYAQQLRASL